MLVNGGVGLTLTSLEYVVLAQLNRRARSGYELGKALDGTPMGAFSSSPGSIYPTLNRLEAAKLVRRKESPRGRRPRREFHLTAKGRRWLATWIRAPVTPGDLLRRPGVLALRYSFTVSKEERATLLRRHVRAAREGRDSYARVVNETRRHAVDTSRGALQLARDLLATHLTWAERELRRVTRRA